MDVEAKVSGDEAVTKHKQPELADAIAHTIDTIAELEKMIGKILVIASKGRRGGPQAADVALHHIVNCCNEAGFTLVSKEEFDSSDE